MPWNSAEIRPVDNFSSCYNSTVVLMRGGNESITGVSYCYIMQKEVLGTKWILYLNATISIYEVALLLSMAIKFAYKKINFNAAIALTMWQHANQPRVNARRIEIVRLVYIVQDKLRFLIWNYWSQFNYRNNIFQQETF